MTNGEKMQEMFPEGKTKRCRGGVVFESDGWCHAYDSDWWNTEHKEPTTKNDLGVDCISRDSAIKALDYDIKFFEFKPGVSKYMDDIAKLLNTIYEIQVNNIKAVSSVTPQEPFKPMVEIDLYSVIKQKYIEREVLEKIRAEIRANSIYVMPQYGRTIREADVLHIIDKYKAESEEAKTK